MSFFTRFKNIETLSFISVAALALAMLTSSFNITTESMFTVSLIMFVTCSLNASHLLGVKPAVQFIFLSLILGFFAEFMGENYGWFFGEYEFTSALGPRLFGVPVVIPMMWFNLCYIAYVLSNLILSRAPREKNKASLATKIRHSALAAFLVTGYDLAADPYMVYVAKAWIMKKTDGWWFGETLQGFVGWAFMSFLIVFVFRWITCNQQIAPMKAFTKKHALIPVGIYFSWMCFQVMYSYPIETRTVSFFVLGIPISILLFSYDKWSWLEQEGVEL